MRAHFEIVGIVGLLLCLCGSACGGGATPEPGAAKKSAKSSSAKHGETGGEEASETAEDEGTVSKKSGKASKAKDEPEDTSPKPTRTAQDIITAPDVSFVFSFTNSEVGEKADERCAKKSKDDPKKQNQCMAKERKKIVADIQSFTKDKAGKWWWTISRMQGSRLKALHKVQVEFADDKADSITVKPVGKDRGTKPWRNPPAKVVISVPNEFSMAIDDPTHGKMVYEAKIGIVGNE